MKNNRTADESIYNDEKYHATPKEYFKLLNDKINEINAQKKEITLLDVGCANGALLDFLGKKNPSFKLIGIEPVLSLIKLGETLNPNIKFINKGLYEIKEHDLTKVDYVLCAGVIGIFNNPKKFVWNLLKLLNPGGSILIFSPFNEEPVDVILKYKYSDAYNFEIGHNLFSMRTMESIAMEKKLTVEWVNFKMPFSIEKTNDPMRSWTEFFRGDPNAIIYGTNMFSTMKLLVLRNK
jgi:2-polyprenyl-3-methyl-5-hydroxy-6-metoxy-1,4-benzoquinol methylase